MGSIASGYLQSILGSALQITGLTTKTPANTSGSGGVSSLAQQPDNSQLSPFAQLVNKLQQLVQSNPAQYQKVTQQIASNLQNAAQSAQSSGNAALSSQLNQLATSFSNASQSGQLPSVQDLTQGIFGHHQHGSHAEGANSVSQLFSKFQADGSNPTAIILNTLSGNGIGG